MQRKRNGPFLELFFDAYRTLTKILLFLLFLRVHSLRLITILIYIDSITAVSLSEVNKLSLYDDDKVFIKLSHLTLILSTCKKILT